MIIEGQLLPDERRALHRQVIDSRRRLVLEVGTWKGGGSTLQIVTALMANGEGHLHTCEPNAEFHSQAADLYRGDLFARHVTLHNDGSQHVIARLLDAGLCPD